mmetsp:Transcript_7675/g.8915  ORF Transcript_7675/g.8915 Transcript_7675/m.8915 type:complete len:309 (+) Transcript_7675:74-1000(+)
MKTMKRMAKRMTIPFLSSLVLMVVLLSTEIFVGVAVLVEAFTGTTTCSTISSTTTLRRSITATTTQLSAMLPTGYQEFGERVIREAAIECGMVFTNTETETDDSDTDTDTATDDKNQKQLDIEWKGGKIIVTVYGNDVTMSSSSSTSTESSDDEEDDDDDESIFDLDVDNDNEAQKDKEKQDVLLTDGKIDLTLLGRTINRMFDDDGIGLAIAEVHSIEVTTPGVSNDLLQLDPALLNVYRGFEVIVEQVDKKTKNKAKVKNKIIEGRLVERNAEFTIVNIKGRMKKMKNETVLSIQLPKAKKEKGAR